MAGIEVKFNNQSFWVEPGDSLLAAAEKNQLNISFSCRSGICQICLVQVQDGYIPPNAQQGLSPVLIKQGFALACQLKPESPLVIRDSAALARSEVRVIQHERITTDILKLRLSFNSSENASWIAGQYLTVWRNGVVGRPYSIASLPSEGELELHIKRHAQGKVSRWLYDEVATGDLLTVSSPVGSCCYDASMHTRPLLLVGTGTGLAPLVGIVQDALAQQHQGPIVLYHGAREADGLYLDAQLQQLASEHPQFNYIPQLGSSDQLATTVLGAHTKLQHWCVFLCGAPDLVRKLQKRCFLNGASMSDIHADPFIEAQVS